ncbi:MAG: acyl-CoA dehydrogenase [Proteobacteria bacterium]|nr:acyl-CoA dehydrogenase [Pseudomonadota bacterium]
MSNRMFEKDMEEKLFLLKKVMKVNVLTHASAFQQYTIDQFAEFLENGARFAENELAPLNRVGDEEGVRVEKGRVTTPSGFKAAWKKAVKEGWTKICAPGTYQGMGLPESVGIAVQEAFFAANPAFCYYLSSTIEVANLIERFGSDQQKKLYCGKLFNGNWAGSFSFNESQPDMTRENIRTTAVQEKDHFRISGTKSHIVAGSHDLTENIVHLVWARIGNLGGDSDVALFIVPKFRLENRKKTDNHVRLEKVHRTMGIKGAPFCTISYGKEGECRGYPLNGIAPGRPGFLQSLNGIRLQIALQAAAQTGTTYSSSLAFANRKPDESGFDTAEESPGSGRVPMDSPQVVDSVMFLKAISEGIRGAVYMTAFYNDCRLHGGNEQKEYFSDLAELYNLIIKAYATNVGLEAVRRGIQLFGQAACSEDLPLEQNYRDLQTGAVLGGSNQAIAEEFVGRTLKLHDGRSFQHLLKQFEAIETHLARTEAMNEAISVWKDYIGGLIILADDLKHNGENTDPRQVVLFAGRTLSLFGDVVLCYHLIRQGMEAESQLEEAGANFYTLKEEAVRNPDFRKWYNKIITAEYFALNVLSQQEASIRIIQRNSSSALDALLTPYSRDT